LPSPAPVNNPQQAYRRTQFLPTPFPDAYESQLSRAARQLGVAVPDVFSRHRREGGAFGVCPPHDMDGEGRRNPRIEIARAAGAAYNASSMDPPALQSLARITVGLVLVSYNAPESLAATLKSWAEGGLLDLVDDRLAFLNAPLQAEIDMCVAHGFRVYTPHAEEVQPILRRHDGWLSRFRPSPQLDAFPPTRFHKGDTTRPATYVAPAQLLAYLDMSTDLILFAEKDYALPEAQNTEQLVRSLLASVAMLQANTAVVRLRRTDDPNREALQNCCNGDCGGSFNNFGEGCVWSAHLNWLSLFCDMEGIEDRSRGALRACMDERGQSAKGKAMLDFIREQGLEGVAAAPADGRYTLPVELQPDGSPSSVWRSPPAAPPLGGEGSNGTHAPAGGNATVKERQRRLDGSAPVGDIGSDGSSNASSGTNTNSSTASSSAANGADSDGAHRRKYGWVEPMRTFCFSLAHSNWSNNVAMFGRRWWIEALGHGAVLTEGDNGAFRLRGSMQWPQPGRRVVGLRDCSLTGQQLLHRRQTLMSDRSSCA
jgi:hypothetical protein